MHKLQSGTISVIPVTYGIEISHKHASFNMSFTFLNNKLADKRAVEKKVFQPGEGDRER